MPDSYREGSFGLGAGKRQGYDPNNAAYRGKEIYDPASNAWYWLDNVQQLSLIHISCPNGHSTGILRASYQR